MKTICDCARENNISVVLGFSENDHDSLYIAQAIISPDGTIQRTRRKMKPTHMERTIFGDASGHVFRSVASLPVGRVGALSCWEHIQPLLKFQTFSQREDIHVAAWPCVAPHSGGGPDLYSMSTEGMIVLFFFFFFFYVHLDMNCTCMVKRTKDKISIHDLPNIYIGCQTLARTYAIESTSFVLHSTTVITEKGVDANNTHGGMLMSSPGGGSSAVFGPDGRCLSKPIESAKEGIIYADLDMNEITRIKMFADSLGHYSRPDLMWLSTCEDVKTMSR